MSLWQAFLVHNWSYSCSTLYVSLFFALFSSGDACVPLVYAHLEGAEQVTLDGVFHSVDKPEEWYGSDGVVDSWLKPVLRELRPAPGAKIAFPRPFANLWR